MEGTSIPDIDIAKLGGGIANKAVTQTNSTRVSDGILTIQFMDNVPGLDYPSIAGIEINRIGEGPPVTAPIALSPTPPTKAPVAPAAPTLAPTKTPQTSTNTTAPVAPAAPTKIPTKSPVTLPPSPTKAPMSMPPFPAFEPILINCGGGRFVDFDRRVWSPDVYFFGGNWFDPGLKAIAETFDDELYSNYRWGAFEYRIPVPEGLFEVILHYAET